MTSKKLPKQIRILILAKSIDGGTGTFLLDILKLEKKFRSLNFAIKSLVLEMPSYRFPPKNKINYFSGKNSYPDYYNLTFNNFTKFYKELLWVKKNINKFKPCVILSIDAHSNLLALICKILFRVQIKVIATTHIDLSKTLSSKSALFTEYLLKIVINIFYNRADKLIGVSNGVSKNLRKDFNLNNQVVTIYNGIQLRKKTARKKAVNGSKILITVARLNEQKDIENLLVAFSILQKKLPDTKLWILGDGPKRNELEALAKKLNIENKVYFWGWVKNVSSYLSKSDLYILSSKREGFSYVLLEAMAVGIPIVSTDTPYGPADVLDNGKYGVLIPVGKPKDMSRAVYNLLTDRRKYDYFSDKSLERADYFSVNKMLSKYRDNIIALF